jgi:hypothetical protein
VRAGVSDGKLVVNTADPNSVHQTWKQHFEDETGSRRKRAHAPEVADNAGRSSSGGNPPKKAKPHRAAATASAEDLDAGLDAYWGGGSRSVRSPVNARMDMSLDDIIKTTRTSNPPGAAAQRSSSQVVDLTSNSPRYTGSGKPATKSIPPGAKMSEESEQQVHAFVKTRRAEWLTWIEGQQIAHKGHDPNRHALSVCRRFKREVEARGSGGRDVEGAGGDASYGRNKPAAAAAGGFTRAADATPSLEGTVALYSSTAVQRRTAGEVAGGVMQAPRPKMTEIV